MIAGNPSGACLRVESVGEGFAQCADPSAGPQRRLQERDVVAGAPELEPGNQSSEPAAYDHDALRGRMANQSSHGIPPGDGKGRTKGDPCSSHREGMNELTPGER